MRYKNTVQLIEKKLKNYVSFVNEREKTYIQREKQFNNKLHEMRTSNKYTAGYIAEYASFGFETSDLTEQVLTEQKKVMEELKLSLKVIQKELDTFFNAPISAEFASKINSIKTLGLQLSDKEFELLQKEAHTYMEMRLIDQLGKTRTKNVLTHELKENGNIDVVHKDVNDGYIGIMNVNLEDAYKKFEEYSNAAIYLVQNYIGREILLKDCLPSNDMVVFAATADTFIIKNFTGKFIDYMDSLNSMLDDKTALTPLSENEKKVVDYLIKDPKYASTFVPYLCKIDAYIEQLFIRDDRYSKYVIV